MHTAALHMHVCMHLQVAAGQLHTVLLTADGAVLCCGAGGSGALGTGELCDSAAPRTAQLPERARAVAAGGFHSLAVGQHASRIVYGWGSGASGQLGMPGAEFLPPPAEEEAGAVVPPPAALQARQARQAAARHAPRATPCALVGAPRCAMIAAGGYHSLMLSQQVLAACGLPCAHSVGCER
jgi:alpha-tubulin suppressor-like RCC1 family protein